LRLKHEPSRTPFISKDIAALPQNTLLPLLPLLLLLRISVHCLCGKALFGAIVVKFLVRQIDLLFAVQIRVKEAMLETFVGKIFKRRLFVVESIGSC
jgi:hypothetical protein